MIELLTGLPFGGAFLKGAAIVAVLSMLAAVVVERGAFRFQRMRHQQIERRYAAMIRRALGGDEGARRALQSAPARHKIITAAMLITPLIENRHPEAIARVRDEVRTLALGPLVMRYLRSRRWWHRAIALRAIGLLQWDSHTALAIAALDDPHPDVRAAALDALTDLGDPRSLEAIVVRLHDSSLQRGRRAAALAAFGIRCEPFLLDLANVDPAHRRNYARALTICGTARARPVLCAWTSDARGEVRAAAFEALAHVGLDPDSARRAIEALESDEAAVREMAAYALRDWTADADAAAQLARHLDDTWTVAVRAARSLQSMGDAGIRELQASALRRDLVGVLARQMLWQGHVPA